MFRIAGKRYDSGLALHSPAQLVYRVPEGFRKLHAVAGVDDSVVAPGHFVLQILGDGKELARHQFDVLQAEIRDKQATAEKLREEIEGSSANVLRCEEEITQLRARLAAWRKQQGDDKTGPEPAPARK